MKKLGKLSINPEKVMKNDELVSLRGGYQGGTACCLCSYNYVLKLYIVGSSPSECYQDCAALGYYGNWVC